MASKKYELTPDHRAQLDPWRDKWIANAFGTGLMSGEERAQTLLAVRGLYRAAGLTPPPDDRIVIVPSPTVARFTGGFAAAIWWRRKNPSVRVTAATEAATGAATGAATEAATRAATGDATRAATGDATGAATGAATWAATGAATWAATEAATRAARNQTDADASSWFRIPSRMFAQLAHVLLQDDAVLGLQCAVNAYQMWNGGNQWSGWVAFLSFFRHVAKLAIDYTKWDAYETLARVGPRVMHAEFCLVSERPIRLTVDDQNRAHGADGPYCEWADGTALYAWHGVQTPAWIIETPERITVSHIQQEQNAEIRRVLLERFGFDRYIRESGAVPVHADAFGTLYRCELPGEEEPLVVVSVLNSTAEPDGHSKQYVLRVEPELKPLPPGDWSSERKREFLDRQQPQALTARNAVASLHGLRGEAYAPTVET